MSFTLSVRYGTGGGSNEDELLGSCYRRAFELAKEHELKSIAFPAISTGIYRFPLERATGIARTETERVLNDPGTLQEIHFVCFGDNAFETYNRIFADLA